MMLEPAPYSPVLEIAVSTSLRRQRCSTAVRILMFGCCFYALALRNCKELSLLLFKTLIIDAPACLSI